MDVIGPKFLRVVLLAIHIHLHSTSALPNMSKSGLILVCNVNIVCGNLKSENSKDMETSTKLYVHEFGFCLSSIHTTGSNSTSISRIGGTARDGNIFFSPYYGFLLYREKNCKEREVRTREPAEAGGGLEKTTAKKCVSLSLQLPEGRGFLGRNRDNNLKTIAPRYLQSPPTADFTVLPPPPPSPPNPHCFLGLEISTYKQQLKMGGGFFYISFVLFWKRALFSLILHFIYKYM